MDELRDDNVDFRVLVRAPIERVFRALATAEGLNEWFTTGTELEAQPGGEIMFRFKNHGVDDYTGEYPGKVLEYHPPTRYVFQWEADTRGYFTTATFSFTPVADGTLVRVHETGFKNDDDGMKDLLNRVAGWASVLTEMKFFLEHGLRY
ncbi:MAG: SRPBCC domain-containing protein [Anaerolineaceae bacterium]